MQVHPARTRLQGRTAENSGPEFSRSPFSVFSVFSVVQSLELALFGSASLHLSSRLRSAISRIILHAIA